MTIKKLLNRVPEVRIMDSTRYSSKKHRAMIGKEYKIIWIGYNEKAVAVSAKDNDDSFCFNLSDVRFLTPISFRGTRIAIGDEVKWEFGWVIVYDYDYYNGERGLNAVKGKDLEGGCMYLKEKRILNHRTGQKIKEMTVKDVEDLAGCKVKIIKE